MDDLTRDAILLWCVDHAFTRWVEATPLQRERYLDKARRLREHMATYEGCSQ